MEILDLKSAAFRDDPYRELRRARHAGPVCYVEPFGFVTFLRYNDVHTITKNPKLFSSEGTTTIFPVIKGAEWLFTDNMLIGDDPPKHTRIRRLMQRAFTLQTMAAWEPRIESIAKTLFDSLENKSSFDLIKDLAIPLPITVIAEMLGVAGEDLSAFKRWSDDMVAARSVSVADEGPWRRRREQEIVNSLNDFCAYFDRVIEERRRHPGGDDLISQMIRTSEEGAIIQPKDVIVLTRLLLVAGNETTTNLIGTAMLALLNHPEQWEDLKANVDLAPNAVEEALRFCGPALTLTRRATEDTEIAGIKIAANTVVGASIGSANHDEAKFPNPDKFDIRRDTDGHMGFGSGIHLCVGAPLARIETRIALRELATRLPDLALTNKKPEWLDSFSLRGLKTLPLKRTLKAQPRRGQIQGEDLVF